MKDLLLIFVKNPIIGRVKTRLAATVGDQNALWVYNHLIVHTSQIIKNIEADIQVWYTDFEGKKDVWDEFDKRVQIDGDLGQKMSHAFEQGFQKGYERIIIIGSDCFDLQNTHITAAFQELNTKEVVIGPALDGGYYLLGMTLFRPEIFQNIAWSTSEVFNTTKKVLEKHDWAFSTLPVLRDIDTEEDLKISSPDLYTELIEN